MVVLDCLSYAMRKECIGVRNHRLTEDWNGNNI
ncbi:hypothetical protein LG52_659 [Geobacillus kaustophilus]|uniref:Uncharacterized protein n=1 Tax=Geobacillus kaustophilus TaxID=1462 RepID=A0A0D8BWN8_GEOKU|nr:hypothetical protein LG52_659 [Geobacillus kaustophilus]